MSAARKKKVINEVELQAQKYLELNAKRAEIEREARQLKKELESLKESLQKTVGVAESLGVPYVTQVGEYYITQIKKYREVKAYNYEFIEFSVSEEV